MGFKWTIAFLFCSLVLGSAFGETVRSCDSGDVCATASSKDYNGDGTELCCPDGYSISTSSSSVNGVTTSCCTCTQFSGNTQVNAINNEVNNNHYMYQMPQDLPPVRFRNVGK
ncbi:hypothetical protein ACOMHN_047097 [Nucella lapillus]